MRLDGAIDALLASTVADGRSPATVEGYRKNLGYLAEFLGADVEVEDITPQDLRRYAADLHGRRERYSDHPSAAVRAGGLSTFSIASYLRSVRRLFNFLVEEGILSASPAARMKLPSTRRREAPKAVSLEDFERLLSATVGGDPVSVRDRALLLVLADTGCRVGGLTHLRLADLDLAHGRATITEKGQKTRSAFFSPVTVAALRSWLSVRPATPEPWVFMAMGSRSHGRLTEEGVGEVLRRLKTEAEVTGPCNPHAFRHAFAREFLRNGGDIGVLSDIMGHSSVTVTWQFYAVWRHEELARFHAQYSPVARMGETG